MKKILLATIGVVLTFAAYADVCHVIGYQSGHTFDGPTACSQGSSGSITVNGPFLTTSTTFTDAVLVHGPIKATKSSFGTLSIASDVVTLNASKAKSIEVLKNGDEQQKVYLKNGSQVGTITFDKGDGIVYVSGKSKLKKISGGIVKHQ